jgi:GntR family transcriptional regulator
VAAFAIDRLGLAGGEPAEWRHTIVRGDRFSVTARFSPAEGYKMA